MPYLVENALINPNICSSAFRAMTKTKQIFIHTFSYKAFSYVSDEIYHGGIKLQKNNQLSEINI